jgi:chorismate mutase
LVRAGIEVSSLLCLDDNSRFLGIEEMSRMDDGSLEKLRKEIGEIDNQILGLVKQRLDCAMKIGEIKKRHGLPVVDANVEKGVHERASRWSREFGLDQDFTLRLVNLLISEAVRVQERPPADK